MPNLTLIKDTLHRLQVPDMDMSSMNFTQLFQTYTELEHLEVYSCKITAWPDFSLAYKLKQLNLNYNKITSYPPTPGFPANNILETLHISGNKADNLLDSISSFFEGLPRLIRLGMSDVGTTVWPNVSSYIGTLSMLHIATNPLNGIDFPRLLGVNNVTSPELPPGGYPNFVDLHLNTIGLRYFPEELFSIFPKLNHLRIAYNQDLTNVPNFTLIHSTLSHLEIQYNGYKLHSPYSTIDYETVFHDMTRLNNIYMWYNNLPKFPFSAEFLINHMPALRRLYIRDNMIESIPDLTSVGNTAYHGDMLVGFLKLHLLTRAKIS